MVWVAKNDNRPPMAFAGIWRPWTGTRGTKKAPIEGEHLLYSFLMTEVVEPIHPKAVPVILADEQSWYIWLNGSVEETLELQRPAPADMIKIVAHGTSKED
ncbi:hypothetical protein G5V57_31350 [Nordella sp. HKS 07]|uniref:SOS response-associated peptidase family protein n=1 Tax=Nordella sp. HKS 07 TaxID=2712222 RepID=UPI0013E0F07A|nr:SOS response-associated peptidase family protein [Nordella sp. HKS 07]QIG51812.1 hypothetical protein G5V57_31350 [Nordella sp. HKS 07]